MEIPPVNSPSSTVPVNSANQSAGSEVPIRQVIAAIHEVNQSELMGEGRQVTFARDPDTRRPVIQIVDESTGEVVDQFPPESILKLAEQLR